MRVRPGAQGRSRSSRTRRRLLRPPATTPEPTPDPIAILIATSDNHFEAGRKELALGHLERAKVEFDRALDTLLESPDGARGDPRLREHFDRLVDRISVLEQTALATGDGFTETKSEPASIDALLAIETFESTSAEGRPPPRRCRPTSSRRRTTFRFRPTTACCATSSCSRAGCANS